MVRRVTAKVDVDVRWVGFDIPDEFVVGYGLDYDDLYRNLPYLAALEPSDLAPSDVARPGDAEPRK